MVSKFDESYVGKVYNYLTIVKRVPSDHTKVVMILCKCQCGKDRVAGFCRVIKNQVKSCGCYKPQRLSWYTKYEKTT